jgi:hypothetical protein
MQLRSVFIVQGVGNPVKKTFPILTVIFSLILVTACILPVATPTLSAPAPMPPTSTPQPPASLSATSTLQPPAGDSTTPTPRSAQIPERLLSAAGPWYIFWGIDGLYAMNPDGSGVTRILMADFQLSQVTSQYQLSSVSPNGGRLAVIQLKNSGPDQLLVLQLPQGNVLAQFPLMTTGLEMTSWNAGESEWSPDGTQLAFVSAENGVSSDVYLYTLGNANTERLSSGPDQSARLSWSPDGKYIFNVAVVSFGTGAGEAVSGAWATTPGGDNKYLYDPYPYSIPVDQQTPGGRTTINSAGEYNAGWIDIHTFLAYSWNPICGSYGLRSFNIDTRQATVYWKDCFNRLANNPAATAFLLSAPYGVSDPGTYLVNTPGQSVRLAASADDLIWSVATGSFLALIDGQVFSYDASGKPGVLPFSMSALPGFSSDRTTWSWVDANGTYVGNAVTGKTLTVLPTPGQVAWEPGTSNLIVCTEGNLYVARAPDYSLGTISIPVGTCQGAQVVLP